MTVLRKHLILLISALSLALLVWGGYRYYTCHTVRGYLSYLYGAENIRKTEDGVWEYTVANNVWENFSAIRNDSGPGKGFLRQIDAVITSMKEPRPDKDAPANTCQEITTVLTNNSDKMIHYANDSKLCVKLQGNYYPLFSLKYDLLEFPVRHSPGETIEWPHLFLYEDISPKDLPRSQLYLCIAAYETTAAGSREFFAFPLRLK